jgi:cell wall assembly regulator SMI1
MQEWNRIELRLTELGCLSEMALLPGAVDEEIAALEGHIGFSLPPSLQRFLKVHDGQNGFGLMMGNQFLSIAGIRQQWDNWRSLDEDAMNEDCADSMDSSPDGVIKPMYTNRAWIPLTHDGGGNHIGLDFDPGKLGKSGQVIAFGRDEDIKRLVADDFETFLAKNLSWLESASWNGKYLDAPHIA